MKCKRLHMHQKCAYQEKHFDGEGGWKGRNADVICLLACSCLKFQVILHHSLFIFLCHSTYNSRLQRKWTRNFHILSFNRFFELSFFNVRFSLCDYFYIHTIYIYQIDVLMQKNVIDTNYTETVQMWSIWYYNDIEVN